MVNWKRVGLGIGGAFAVVVSALVVTKVVEARLGVGAAARMRAELDIIAPAGSNKLASLNQVYKGENIYYVISTYSTAYCWANLDHEYVSGFGANVVCTNPDDQGMNLIRAKIDEVRA